jgi:hypothetical protein
MEAGLRHRTDNAGRPPHGYEAEVSVDEEGDSAACEDYGRSELGTKKQIEEYPWGVTRRG